MKRSEALAVLHEILCECRETVIIGSVSLDSREPPAVKSYDGFEIKVRCDLDKHSRSLIKPILDKHQLAMKEE